MFYWNKKKSSVIFLNRRLQWVDQKVLVKHLLDLLSALLILNKSKISSSCSCRSAVPVLMSKHSFSASGQLFLSVASCQSIPSLRPVSWSCQLPHAKAFLCCLRSADPVSGLMSKHSFAASGQLILLVASFWRIPSLLLVSWSCQWPRVKLFLRCFRSPVPVSDRMSTPSWAAVWMLSSKL